MEISQLITYPIKSTGGARHHTYQITRHGLQYDRSLAIFDSEGQVMTGRIYPQLLDIQCTISEQYLLISYDDAEISKINLNEGHSEQYDLSIFKYSAHGKLISDPAINDWLSTLVGQSARLMILDQSKDRPVLAKHGGREGDVVSFCDQAPILILSEASMDDLNTQLESPISLDRFRPNIVIRGCAAYEEDSWDVIRINECRFKIIQQCERCVFTTIDPITKLKHPKGEPLRTLATYRKNTRGEVVFGAHAVPLNVGVIRLGDTVDIEMN